VKAARSDRLTDIKNGSSSENGYLLKLVIHQICGILAPSLSFKRSLKFKLKLKLLETKNEFYCFFKK
jgi:hypothetical protein